MFSSLLDRLVIWQNQVGSLADDQVVSDFYVLRLKAVSFLNKSTWIDNDAIANHAKCATVQNSRGDEVKYKGAAIVYDSVASI